MKNLYKLIAITALVAVIGFSFIACDDGSGGGGGKTLTSITAVYTPTTEIFPDTTLDTLKEGLTVKAHYSDSTSKTLNDDDYTLSGNLTVGESVINVTYTEGGVTKTTTFKVTVDALTHAHNYQLKEVITPATCTTAGMGRWECTAVTPSHHEELEIAALGHAWETMPTVAATETINGREGRVCNNNHDHDEITILYAFGTTGLAFELISINGGTENAYRVRDGGNKNFTTVHIPAFHRADANSPYLPVTSIGSNTGNAFTTVTFAAESQLIAIGTSAFYQCSSLASITIPDSVESIGQAAFRDCTSLASVSIGTSVQSIGIQAFYGCTSLTSITIPDSVQTIDQQAFRNCNLTSVTIGTGVTSIGSTAFNNTSLTSVTFEGTIPSSGFDTNVFQSIGDLRAKFYATDPDNGTPGTYTRSSQSSTWTRQ